MVVECHGSGAAWELPALASYSSLREPWMPTYTVTYWSRAWSPPFGDWATGQYSKMRTTTALLKKLWVKVMDLPSMSPDLNPIEHLWASSNGRWKSVSSLTSTSSVMSSWRSGRGLQWQPVKLLWTSCPRGLRQCWKIMVANKYWHFGAQFGTFPLRGVYSLLWPAV